MAVALPNSFLIEAASALWLSSWTNRSLLPLTTTGESIAKRVASALELSVYRNTFPAARFVRNSGLLTPFALGPEHGSAGQSRQATASRLSRCEKHSSWISPAGFGLLNR